MQNQVQEKIEILKEPLKLDGYSELINKSLELLTHDDLIELDKILAHNVRIIQKSLVYEEFIDEEIRFIESFMRSHDYSFDQAIYETLEKGDTIEIYSLPEMKQIYRSMNFSLFKSYPLMVTRAFPFYLLYKRSEEMELKIIYEVSRFSRTKSYDKFKVPAHPVVEIYGGHSGTYLFSFKNAAPVMDKDNKQAAILITHNSKRI